MWNAVKVSGDLALEFRGRQVNNLTLELESDGTFQEWTLTAGYQTWEEGKSFWTGTAKTFVFRADGLTAAMELAEKVYVPKAQYQLKQILTSKFQSLKDQILGEVGKSPDKNRVRTHWRTGVSSVTVYLNYRHGRGLRSYMGREVPVELKVTNGVVTDEIVNLEELFDR